MEIKLSNENFKKEVLESKIPVLVDFGAEWRGPCRMIAPAVEAIAEEYKEILKACKLDVDEAPDIAVQEEVMGILTPGFFAGGKMADKTAGLASKPEIEQVIKKFIR